MLSLFIGAVTMSMSESLEKMKWEEDMLRAIKNRERAEREQKLADALLNKESSANIDADDGSPDEAEENFADMPLFERIEARTRRRVEQAGEALSNSMQWLSQTLGL